MGWGLQGQQKAWQFVARVCADPRKDIAEWDESRPDVCHVKNITAMDELWKKLTARPSIRRKCGRPPTDRAKMEEIVVSGASSSHWRLSSICLNEWKNIISGEKPGKENTGGICFLFDSKMFRRIPSHQFCICAHSCT